MRVQIRREVRHAAWPARDASSERELVGIEEPERREHDAEEPIPGAVCGMVTKLRSTSSPANKAGRGRPVAAIRRRSAS